MAKQIIPKFDSGYGWLVTFACFSVSFIMQGLARAAGVLYVAIIETYGVSREVATTPFSLRYGVRNMVGPIVGIVAQRFGMRSAVVVGGILASIGGALCSIAPDVLWITILWGVVHGIGYGLCNTVHILILNQYFDKYKATAIALALTGDCFGTFVFPTILDFLLLNYGVGGTFLILGAICLNIVPAGLLMRPPDWSGFINAKVNITDCSETLNICHTTGTENKAFEDGDIFISNLESTNIDKIATPKGKCNSLVSNWRISSTKGYYFNNVLKRWDSKDFFMFDKQKEIQQEIHSSKSSSTKEVHTSFKIGTNRRRLNSIFPPSNTIENKYCTLQERESVEKEDNKFGNVILPDPIEKSENSPVSVSEVNEEIKTPPNSDFVLTSEIENNREVDKIQQPSEISAIQSGNCPTSGEPSTITKRKDSFLDKIFSLPTVVKSEIRDYKPLDETYLNQNCTPSITVYPPSNTKLENSSAGANLTFPMRKHSFSKLNSSLTKCRRVLDNTKSINESQFPENTSISVHHEDCQINADLKGSTNALRQFLTLNIRPLMVLIGINLAAYSFVLIGVFTVIVDYASDQGMEADLSKYLIISFSVADLLGRIGFGVVLDKRWIKLSLYSAVDMALMGISVLIIPISSNYWFMMTCMTVFGLMQGGNAIVYPLLVGEYMSVGEENVALGCLNLYGGLIMLPLATMIGYFRDTIGSYDGVFYTVGGICLLTGILWIFEPLMLKVHQRMAIKSVK